MSDRNYLFRTNPDLFLSYVLGKLDPASSETFELPENLIMLQFIRFGIDPKPQFIDELLDFYRQNILPMDPDQRSKFYRDLLYFPTHYDFVSAEVLIPVMIGESSDGIAATAAIDIASLGSLVENDPMTRVNQIIELLESGYIRNPGAVFGALLNLGDPRVCRLLKPIRDSFKNTDLGSMAKSSTGYIHAPTVHFFIDWLEGLEGDDLDGAFGNVAAALGLLARERRSDQVTDGLRHFPAKNVTHSAWKAAYKAIDFNEFVKSIAPALYALERSEPPLRVMPSVIRAWGMEPLTPKAEEAAILNPKITDKTDSAVSITSWPATIPGGYMTDVRCEWWDGTGQIYIIWGILNPNGPTLYTLGSREFAGKHRIFFRWLHMLGGETVFDESQSNKISYQEIYDSAKRINNYLLSNNRPGIFTTIPNFLIVNDDDETLIRIGKDILRELLSPDTDWGKYVSYAEQFKSDFFGMAGAQIRETYDRLLAEALKRGEEPSDFLKWTKSRYGHLPDFRDAKIPLIQSSTLTPDIFSKWWNIISEPGYNVTALGALRFMWEGATSILSDDMRKNEVPWNPVISFIESYRFYLKDSEYQSTSEEKKSDDPSMAALIKKAEDGNPDAQAELASRIEHGDGIKKDAHAAYYWLEKAAQSGNSWAQTTLAIKLRQTGDADKERQALAWLNKAIEQDDSRARYTRGLHLLAGIGTDQNTISAYLDFITASFSGDLDAKKILTEQQKIPSEEEWAIIHSKIKWPVISIILGPFVTGYSTELNSLRENDDGSENPEWLQQERLFSEKLLLSNDGKESLISVAFDEPVNVKEVFVGRSNINGTISAVASINLKNVQTIDKSLPILYKPNIEALKTLLFTVAVTDGREFYRLVYFNY